MKHLLSGTDFSDGGNNAVAYAAEIAHRRGATLHLLHAYKMQSSSATVLKGLNEILEKDAKEALEGLKEAVLQSHPNLKLVLHAVYGVADEAINQKANELMVDLVLVGTRGKSLLDTLFFGSTSTALSKKIGRPLLLVPPACSFGVGSELTYATALRTDVLPDLLQFLINFGELMEKSFKVLHVFDDHHPLTLMQDQRLMHLQTNLNIPTTEQEMIHNENVVEAILQYVSQHKSAVLIMHLYHYGFLERLFIPSIADELLRKAKLPLLLLPVD